MSKSVDSRLLEFLSDYRKNAFYPGNIWTKRIARLAIVFAIGANVFINDFQEFTLDLIEDRSCQIAAITDQIDVQKLRIRRIEDGSWTETGIDWLAYFKKTPSAKEINSAIDLGSVTLENVEAISSQLEDVDSGIETAMHLLRYTSMLMWIPIALSLLWLLIDLIKGDAKRTVVFGLMAAIPFNILTYRWLIEASGVLF